MQLVLFNFAQDIPIIILDQTGFRLLINLYNDANFGEMSVKRVSVYMKTDYNQIVYVGKCLNNVKGISIVNFFTFSKICN